MRPVVVAVLAVLLWIACQDSAADPLTAAGPLVLDRGDHQHFHLKHVRSALTDRAEEPAARIAVAPPGGATALDAPRALLAVRRPPHARRSLWTRSHDRGPPPPSQRS